MENTMKMYVTADEAAQILGVSRGYAYKIIRGLNNELKEKGYRVISGKVPTKYFEEKFYGMAVGYNDLQQNNVQLEKQQNELKSHIEQMVQSEQLLQRDVRKYDEAPEWQLQEPGAFASAKSFRDKVVMPFVNKLKTLIKNLTIQCVRLKEEVLQLRKEKKRLSDDVEFYKGKIKDMSDRTELLQEKADDLERVKRYAGAEQIDTIIRKVKEQERTEQQIRKYDRSYGTR